MIKRYICSLLMSVVIAGHALGMKEDALDHAVVDIPGLPEASSFSLNNLRKCYPWTEDFSPKELNDLWARAQKKNEAVALKMRTVLSKRSKKTELKADRSSLKMFEKELISALKEQKDELQKQNLTAQAHINVLEKHKQESDQQAARDRSTMSCRFWLSSATGWVANICALALSLAAFYK